MAMVDVVCGAVFGRNDFRAGGMKCFLKQSGSVHIKVRISPQIKTIKNLNLLTLCQAGRGFSNRKAKGKRSQEKKKSQSNFVEDEVKPMSVADARAAEYKEVLKGRSEPALPPDQSVVTDAAFEARLADLKALDQKPATSSGAKSPLGLSPFSTRAAFETDTTSGNVERPVEKDEEGSRLGYQIGAVMAIVVFVVAYSGSDLQMATSGGLKSSLLPGSQGALPSEIQAELRAQADKFEAVLATSFEDSEAIEGAAVTYAKMGEFEKADEYLKRLVAQKPDDVEAIRLWAEVKVKKADLKEAEQKYLQALALSPDNPELLRPYVGVLSQQGKQARAVLALNEIRPRALARGNVGVQGSGSDPVDIVQLELLLGKLLTDWAGHTSDAVVVYDRLIANYKDDFRGYLAKGALLKDIGKAKDAERLFLQARFLAPEAARTLVDQVAAR